MGKCNPVGHPSKCETVAHSACSDWTLSLIADSRRVADRIVGTICNGITHPKLARCFYGGPELWTHTCILLSVYYRVQVSTDKYMHSVSTNRMSRTAWKAILLYKYWYHDSPDIMPIDFAGDLPTNHTSSGLLLEINRSIRWSPLYGSLATLLDATICPCSAYHLKRPSCIVRLVYGYLQVDKVQALVPGNRLA